jgi:hypothetical protein
MPAASGGDQATQTESDVSIALATAIANWGYYLRWMVLECLGAASSAAVELVASPRFFAGAQHHPAQPPTVPNGTYSRGCV